MYLDRNYDAMMFETRDGDKYWAEDGANYVEGAGTVVLNCLSSDGTDTADSFEKIDALGLAIELARSAGIEEAALMAMRYELQRLVVANLLKDFTRVQRADLNLLCYRLFGMGMLNTRMTEDLVEAVITEYQREQS